MSGTRRNDIDTIDADGWQLDVFGDFLKTDPRIETDPRVSLQSSSQTTFVDTDHSTTTSPSPYPRREESASPSYPVRATPSPYPRREESVKPSPAPYTRRDEA
ncbi:hypothetical protein HK097_003206, partial [Rhizophlyctis rosea]